MKELIMGNKSLENFIIERLSIENLQIEQMSSDGYNFVVPICKKDKTDFGYNSLVNYMLYKYQKESAENINGQPKIELHFEDAGYYIAAFIPIDNYGETETECYTEPIKLSNMFQSFFNCLNNNRVIRRA